MSKTKDVFSISSAFLKSTLNFQHFQKKDDRHNRCISEITESEKDE